jgi:hypothetical protein
VESGDVGGRPEPVSAIGGPLLVPFVHFALWVTAITVLFTYLGVRRYRRATSGE